MEPSGKIVQVNRKTEMLFGFTRYELIAAKVSVLLSGGDKQRRCWDEENFLNCLIEETGKSPGFMGKRKDGSEFPIDITVNLIDTEDGQLVICAIRDITESRRLQIELAETHRRLFESIEAERRMLSQELHDGPLQDLYGVALSLQSINEVVKNEEDHAGLVDSLETVQSVMHTLRGICGELRPPTLANLGLEKAIRSHIIKVQEAHPEMVIETQLSNDGQMLPERARLALFRVYQNSINNILRHAQAKKISVRFGFDPQQIYLYIEDDGRGFSVPSRWVDLVRAGHFGLVGMSERVEAIGGHFNIVSAPGRGTKVEVSVPLNISQAVS